MSQNKTQKTAASVTGFLNQIEDDKKRAESLVILNMMESVTGEEAKMWGPAIVGFGDYHYKYDSGREGDMFKVGFSPRKQNFSVYIMPGFERYSELMDKLGKHKTGKSCLYIKRLEDIDEKVLETLVKESYNYMTNKYG